MGSQDAGAILEGLLVQGDGLVEPTCVPISVAEVVACGQGAGVVWSEDAGTVLEGLFVQEDAFVEPTCVPISVGEVVACV